MSTVEMEESTVTLVTNTLQTQNTLDDNNDAVLYSQETYSIKKTTDDSSDDDAAPVVRVKRRVQQFCDSDIEKENNCTHDNLGQSDSSSDAENNRITFKSGLTKSRIHVEVNSSDSDTPKQKILKNEEQQLRIKNKRNKMSYKFKGLVNSRSKPSSQKHNDKPSSEDKSEDSGSEASNSSDNEMSSINKIKQKIRNSMTKITSICDPDTSDEEQDIKKHRASQKHKREQKSTKMIEAKPLRMSAKQAMENMHLIKSESNRMLREKAVSLPYHRPKALSLKDIMARRKPAVTSDGKALPIKMNEEQLKEYALQLEQRQKEMMELCKSESDEDTAEPEDDTNEDKLLQNEEENNELQTDNEIKETISKGGEINIANVFAGSDINSIENEPHNIASIDKDIPSVYSNKEENEKASESMNSETNQNDSNTDIKLVYDNSIEEENVTVHKTDNVSKENESSCTDPQEKINTVCSEQESQLISLHYTENTDEIKETVLMTTKNETEKFYENSEELVETNINSEDVNELSVNSTDVVAQETNSEAAELNLDCEAEKLNENSEEIAKLNENAEPMYIVEDDFLSDDDVNMEDIDRIIENAEIMKNDEDIDTPILTKNSINIKTKKNPKIMGTPGMVIDLDGSDSMPKLSGVELLKERFCYFSKLKTPEELEREREKRTKPGAQHLKLKQELGDKIAEQRSLEWAKRLEEEKQLHEEIDTILDDGDEANDSIEKCERKLDDETDDISSESEGEEEPMENDIEIKDKPRKQNPMLDDEAEESDNDDDETAVDETNNDVEDDNENDEGDNEESSEEGSSESEPEEEAPKHKKGRILKAFEDSDDDTPTNKEDDIEDCVKDTTEQSELVGESNNKTDLVEPIPSSFAVQSSSQDDVLQLAQRHKSASDDLFASQHNVTTNETNKEETEEALGTQTFSISSSKPAEFLYQSQPYHDPNLDGITDGFSQNVLSSQLPTQASQSQVPIGEDILALCTGKFYDNEFVSQTDVKANTISQDDYLEDLNDKQENGILETNSNGVETSRKDDIIPLDKKPDVTTDNTKPKQDLLKSILDELDDPEFNKPKPNKFFTGATLNTDSQVKKRLVIDSDDENNEMNMTTMKKKLKKKKMENRALQISDDEDEEEEQDLDDDLSDVVQNDDREVEYDSEENEIQVISDKPKKKRKATDFFEDEAELTSEDEWVGSGDEDEHGLDRMEREEGDDEVFHQGKLQKELGQIHMRDVMDQDKREVRLLQELLFEDGDLGDGHRQRKFRWRDTGDEEIGTVPDEFADTQEEEFESEEQWRKQRHEREIFLRQMQNKGEEENLNVTVNRNTIIKANLTSKSMSALLMEVNQTKIESVQLDSPAPEKKTVKDVPSPQKSFSIFQQNYHGSLLTRGRGALARLAALATPLAVDDDAPKITSLASHKRNFVFTALTPDDPPKVTIKRKADVGTPKLVKKMRIEEKQNHPKSSLLDHFNL